ncbi:hypothetical protein P3J6_121348 [Pseudoalteromonas sp. 3J6]|nr:hypothetical protein P3J6_121348 [Pseudoalteromonas sp. 3J6]
MRGRICLIKAKNDNLQLANLLSKLGKYEFKGLTNEVFFFINMRDFIFNWL